MKQIDKTFGDAGKNIAVPNRNENIQVRIFRKKTDYLFPDLKPGGLFFLRR